jgi:hypothetical protein
MLLKMCAQLIFDAVEATQLPPSMFLRHLGLRVARGEMR